MTKLSEFICNQVELWLEWNKAFADGKNSEQSDLLRAESYRKSELIVEQINKNITQMDENIEQCLK